MIEQAHIRQVTILVHAALDLREAGPSQQCREQIEIVHIRVATEQTRASAQIKQIQRAFSFPLPIERKGVFKVWHHNPNSPAFSQGPETFLDEMCSILFVEVLEQMRRVQEIRRFIRQRNAVIKVVGAAYLSRETVL